MFVEPYDALREGIIRVAFGVIGCLEACSSDASEDLPGPRLEASEEGLQ